MHINNQFESAESAAEAEVLVIKAEGCEENRKKLIVREHMLDVYINEKLTFRLVCTPAQLPELILGRMITEGLIRGVDEVESIYVCDQGRNAKVFLTHGIALERELQSEPTCCTGNQVLLGGLHIENLNRLECTQWKPEWIFSMAKEFATDSKLHRSTRGTHCCYLGMEGQILCMAEDIGRHNALDKVIGYAAMRGLDFNKCMLFTTGRVPTDMLQKVIAAGIPVLVSKAVPTKEAVCMAEEYNLNLICSAWPDEFEVYNRAE